MIEVYRFNETEILLFALTLLRISACITVMPIFGAKTIPRSTKILLSLIVTLVLFPVLSKFAVLHEGWKEEIILLAGREAILGAFLGFLCNLIFIAVEISGQVLGFSMGFSTAQLVNPTEGGNFSLMEQFQTILGMLLFLSINGHHMFLEALYRSFDLAPLGKLSMNPLAMSSVMTLVQQISVIGVKLAGPMIAVILFLNIAMGVVGRMVPQLNVFVVSFPVNIMVGLFVFAVSIPLMLTVLEGDMFNIGSQIFTFLKGF